MRLRRIRLAGGAAYRRSRYAAAILFVINHPQIGSVQKSSQKLEIQLQQTLLDIILERTQIKVCSTHLLPIFSILHNVWS